ncbi:MAG: hypothetical protein IT566_17870 [Rhodospirillaceae bacterium]|nr:hypothetical protein [Rhodospirillaceae bacterium]
MGLRTVFLTALTLMVMATPAHAGTDIESHPYLLAVAAAEQCEGHRATMVEELRLARAISRDTGARVTAGDVHSALERRRYQPVTDACDNEREPLDLYRSVVSVMLKSPLLKMPETVG